MDAILNSVLILSCLSLTAILDGKLLFVMDPCAYFGPLNYSIKLGDSNSDAHERHESSKVLAESF